MKQSAKETDFAIKKADEGAADLKKRAGELSQNLNEYEKEYQVRFVFYVGFLLNIANVNEYSCLQTKVFVTVIRVINSRNLCLGHTSWKE